MSLNKPNRTTRMPAAAAILMIQILSALSTVAAQPAFSPPGAFRADHDLWTRQTLNFTRLEQEKYWPQNVYQREKEFSKWPGDTEGRTLLAWILLAQTTGREPRYLDRMLAMWPAEINSKGYFGKIYDDAISEQQLSSHGWVLRALSELEAWRPGGPARDLARPIIENLFLPTLGSYARYPIQPSERENAGSYSGSHLKQVGPWILSSDVGCYAIGMSGAIDACIAFGDERLIPLIDEMTDRFLEIDLVAIRAQTHATLTACRGLLRWADATGRPEPVRAAERIYALYTGRAWTETYANFNWFDRPEWTEPCAVVDSLMVAMELWRRTGKTQFLEEAQLIYFNAFGHSQRANGGFGCDSCPGADGSTELAFSVEEAHWCCTMRGSEGLARMSQYQAALDGDTLLLPFGLPGTFGDLHIESAYPKAAQWTISNRGTNPITAKLFIPPWVEGLDPGWKTLALRPGETQTVSGTLKTGERNVLPATAARNPDMKEFKVRFEGPLLLARQNDLWRPVFDDYLRGDMSKQHSAKRLLFEQER